MSIPTPFYVEDINGTEYLVVALIMPSEFTVNREAVDATKVKFGAVAGDVRFLATQGKNCNFVTIEASSARFLRFTEGCVMCNAPKSDDEPR